MPGTIPAFTLNGVLPPFTASPTDLVDRSPYRCDLAEVVSVFATSMPRCLILEGLLAYRAALHSCGATDGMQWVAGSFCEQLQGREPADVDVVTYVRLPSDAALAAPIVTAIQAGKLEQPDAAKAQYNCDAYLVTLPNPWEYLVGATAYWFGVFSHRRSSFEWKGILEIELAPTGDGPAAAELAMRKAAF